MGSLDKYCRLCALHVRSDQLVKLFNSQSEGKEQINTENGAKLANFLRFELNIEDRLPKQVCVQCIQNLDFCVQFVEKCRRIEALLQRGLDVDYVASEVDYSSRYTYLFPSPYPTGQDRPRNQTYPSEFGEHAYFGSTGRDTRVSIESTAHDFSMHSNDRDQYVDHVGGDVITQSSEHPQNSSEGDNRLEEPPQQQLGIIQQTIGTDRQQRFNQVMDQEIIQVETPIKHLTEDNKARIDQQKVAMYRNDISVDNVVVEVEPKDLLPRKTGNVKAEYPWKVGGAPKRPSQPRERLKKIETQKSVSSPVKNARFILPKSKVSIPQLEANPRQVMIPVTLKTPCKTCSKMIIASSLHDLKKHVYQESEESSRDETSIVNTTFSTSLSENTPPISTSSTCIPITSISHQTFPASNTLSNLPDNSSLISPLPLPVDTPDQQFKCGKMGCEKLLQSKNSLKYHQKHCHSIKNQGTGLDIMSIATSELVGGIAKPGDIKENFPDNCMTTNGDRYQVEGAYNVKGKQSGGDHKKVFVCPYQGCSKAYSANNYLVQHMRLHTGERPYSCSNCGKTFSRVLDMKKHRLLKVCY